MTNDNKRVGTNDVAAVIATFRRTDLLMRLLTSMAKGNPEIGVAYIADNGEDESLKEKLKSAPLQVVYISSPNNPGCGAGLRIAEEEALKATEWKYFLILDDDAVLDPGCIRYLRRALENSPANAATPMILDERGDVTSIPGLLVPQPWNAIRTSSREEYLKKCGENPVAFDWCPGVCLLVTRAALEKEGFHSSDFWMLGEDLEFSMRLSKERRNIFVPNATAWHLPPRGRNVPSDWIMIKEAAMLLNSAYLGFHKSYCRRLLKHLPGNVFRFLWLFGFRLNAVKLAVCALYWGAVKRETAGSERFQGLVRHAKR